MRLFRLGCTLLLAMGFSASYGMTNYGPTKSGDTLWKIATQFKPAGISLSQMMTKIKSLNPQAITTHGQLKKGVRLKIPNLATDFKKNTPAQKTSAPTNLPSAFQPTTPALTESSSPTVSKPPVTVVQTTAPNISNSIPPAASTTETTQATAPASNDNSDNDTESTWVITLLLIAAAIGFVCFWYRPHRHYFSEQYSRLMKRLGYDGSPRPKGPSLKFDTLQTLSKPAINVPEDNSEEQHLLLAAREKPTDPAPRVKLLEFYARTNNQAAFKRHADYLTKHLISEDDPLFSKIKSLYLETWVYD